MPSPRHYVPALSLAFLLLVALAAARSDSGAGSQPRISETDPQPVYGTVTFSAGRVEIHGGDSAWRPLYTGDRVAPTDVVRTGATGRAEIAWDRPKRVLRVERSSVVALEGEAVGRHLLLVGAHVDSGALWAQALGSGRALVAGSPHGDAAFDNGAVSLQVGRDGGRLAVYRGRVKFENREVTEGTGLIGRRGEMRAFRVPADDDMRDGWRDAVGTTPGGEDGGSSSASASVRLTRDLRDLNPEIYLGVEVELVGTEGMDRRFTAEEARIRTIRVRADKWDGMGPDQKVRLLNDTFAVLKARYPSILETVVLEFDDDRPDLSLKYAASPQRSG